jgi:molybdopterin-guanine dinucleotide biosynthesis protein MobB
MRLVGLCGWSGAGKTTLLARLIPELRARDYSVSTIKHAHHGFDVDRPGKDSYIHRECGASEVLVASERRWALIHELREEVEPALHDLLAHLSPVDLVLVEGFKRDHHPKIEVHRALLGKPLLQPDDPYIMAVASDTRPGVPVPVLDLNNSAAIADFVLQVAMSIHQFQAATPDASS